MIIDFWKTFNKVKLAITTYVADYFDVISDLIKVHEWRWTLFYRIKVRIQNFIKNNITLKSVYFININKYIIYVYIEDFLHIKWINISAFEYIKKL